MNFIMYLMNQTKPNKTKSKRMNKKNVMKNFTEDKSYSETAQRNNKNCNK